MILPDFRRYLSAKKTIDDRSLNRWVYQTLRTALAGRELTRPLAILEIGCGIGTMIERLWEWKLTARAVYTAIDREADLIAGAEERLQAFARRRQLVMTASGAASRLAGEGRDWQILLKAMDFFEFPHTAAASGGFDLIVAHAVLDLLDLEVSLPRLLRLLRPGGLYYFTLNFDGVTIFQPACDPEFEADILACYHRTMDERQGGRGGHSQTGRRLLPALCRHSTVLAAGSSDWLVWPTPARAYPAEEAFFLHCLLDFLAAALPSRPELDQERLQAWLDHRRAQIAAGELIFLAHQIDVCGRLAEGGGQEFGGNRRGGLP
ncbi:MAG: methyltransferase [Desulfobacca sp.]|uniref:methyltransferase n=1 Tax=Desulfobacca sp. TaxID=2067990 RepID=UPI004049CB63